MGKLENLDLAGKKVLMRVDFNVPLNKDFEVTDATRIRAALPTIQYILEKGGRLILMSHLGRPQKKKKEDGSIDRARFSLKHILEKLSDLVGKEAKFVEDTIGEEVVAAADELKDGELLLLENTRFYKEEKKGDEVFAKELAAIGDLYVNDAFGAAHREHASTATVAQFFAKDQKAFGFLMQKEIEAARKLLDGAASPYVAIVGGAKVSDKILLLDKLVEVVDKIIIGGGMAYTLLLAKGARIGNSLVEADKLDVAKAFLTKAEARGVEVLLPEDSVVADAFDNEANQQTVSSMEIPEAWMGLDIGPEAIAAFRAAIVGAKSVLWNGPMGVFEMMNFAKGTNAVADAVAEATQENGAYTLVGGGDSVAALTKSGKAALVSHVSTGGGATLEFLQGNKLPGVEAMLS